MGVQHLGFQGFGFKGLGLRQSKVVMMASPLLTHLLLGPLRTCETEKAAFRVQGSGIIIYREHF